jgi:hypothetical protein
MSQPQFEPPKKNSMTTKVFLGIFLALLILGTINSLSGKPTAEQTSSQIKVEPSWIPSDFFYWPENPNVAYKYVEEVPDSKCTLDICMGIYVVSKEGCPRTIYAEMDIIDKSGIKIAYSNDSLNSLSPLEQGMLVFDFSLDEILSMGESRISDISCL